MSQLRNRIRKLREETGLSQKDFAVSWGVEQSKYNKWENGKNAPGYDDICTLAKIFGCTTDYLLGLSDVKTQDESEKDRIIKMQQEKIYELETRINSIKNITNM